MDHGQFNDVLGNALHTAITFAGNEDQPALAGAKKLASTWTAMEGA